MNHLIACRKVGAAGIVRCAQSASPFARSQCDITRFLSLQVIRPLVHNGEVVATLLLSKVGHAAGGNERGQKKEKKKTLGFPSIRLLFDRLRILQDNNDCGILVELPVIRDALEQSFFRRPTGSATQYHWDVLEESTFAR